MNKKKVLFLCASSFLLAVSMILGAFAADICDHNWLGDADTTVNNGCSYTIEEWCSICNETRTATYNDEYGGDHDWQYQSGYVDVTNDCMSVITYKCSLCGITKEENGVPSHKYSDIYDYVDETTHVAHCTECGSEVSQSHVFDSGEITVAPTCTSDGVKTYSCFFCSATKTESIDATGHRMGEWGANLNGQHARCCQNGNGCALTEFEDHIDSNADALCDVCNWTMPSSDSTGSEETEEPSDTEEPVEPEEHTHTLSKWFPRSTGGGCLRYCESASCSYYETEEEHIDSDSDDFCDRCNSSLDGTVDVCFHGLFLENCTYNAETHTGYCSLCKNWVIDENHYYSNGQTCVQCGYIKGNIIDSETEPDSSDPSLDNEKDKDDDESEVGDEVDLRRLFGAALGATLIGGLCYGVYSLFKPEPKRKQNRHRKRKNSSYRKGRKR